MLNKRKQLLPGSNYFDSFLHAYIHSGLWYSVRLFMIILINVIEMSESYDAHSTQYVNTHNSIH